MFIPAGAAPVMPPIMVPVKNPSAAPSKAPCQPERIQQVILASVWFCFSDNSQTGMIEFSLDPDSRSTAVIHKMALLFALPGPCIPDSLFVSSFFFPVQIRFRSAQ